MLANCFRNLIRTNVLYRSSIITNHPELRSCLPIGHFSTNPKNNDSGPEASKQEPSEQNEQQQQNQANLEKLLAENKTLLENFKDLDDKYKRSLAEAENTRMRSKKQVEDAKIYAIQGFCKDLLEVADIFKAAIDSVPKETMESNVELKSLYDGVVMTEQKLLNVFQRHGLCQINPIGLKFDPNEHHALFQVDDPGKEPGTVSTVTKIGFKLHDRTIRPAMVGVVKSS